jgi:uncharacterized protein YkwD
MQQKSDASACKNLMNHVKEAMATAKTLFAYGRRIFYGLGLVLILAGQVAAQTQSGDEFINTVNSLRQQPHTCAEARYAGGETDPPMSFSPAAPLKRNSTLDKAAQSYADAVAKGQAIIQEEPRFVGPSGYLPWRSAAGYEKISSVVESQLANRQLTDPFGCRRILSSGYSEIGVGVAYDGTRTTFLYIVAEPFHREQIPAYSREIFDNLNSLRVKGLTCFGKTYPPRAPFVWSDGLALAAQRHSDDMANWPFPGTDPNNRDVHKGSDGSTPQQRVTVPNNGVFENVATNADSTMGPVLAWTDQVKPTAMTAGHCAVAMSDQKHAGIGINIATPLASTLYGRHPWVTLNVATVTGEPTQPSPEVTTGPVGPGNLSPQPTATAEAFGKFDSQIYYRITSLGFPDRSLDILPHDHSRPAVFDNAVVINPRGNYTGQMWRLKSLPQTKPAPADKNYPHYVMMSTEFQGDDQKMTSNTGAPPALLRRMFDQSNPTDVPKKFQYWLFSPVPGQPPGTYRITNGYWGRSVVMGAKSDGSIGFVRNPRSGDQTTYWKVETYGAK